MNVTKNTTSTCKRRRRRTGIVRLCAGATRRLLSRHPLRHLSIGTVFSGPAATHPNTPPPHTSLFSLILLLPFYLHFGILIRIIPFLAYILSFSLFDLGILFLVFRFWHSFINIFRELSFHGPGKVCCPFDVHHLSYSLHTLGHSKCSPFSHPLHAQMYH